EPQHPSRRLAMQLVLGPPGPIVADGEGTREACEKLAESGLLTRQDGLFAVSRLMLDGAFAGIWSVLQDRLRTARPGVGGLGGEMLRDVWQGPPSGGRDETLEAVLAAFVAAYNAGLGLYSGRRAVRQSGDLEGLVSRPWNVRSIVRLLRHPADHLV